MRGGEPDPLRRIIQGHDERGQAVGVHQVIEHPAAVLADLRVRVAKPAPRGGSRLLAQPQQALIRLEAAMRIRQRADKVGGLRVSGQPGETHAPTMRAGARRLGELGSIAQAALARRGEEIVAMALFVQGNGVLYGRYWGASVDVPGLHFELCYYCGIEYAISSRLRQFEPGAQEILDRLLPQFKNRHEQTDLRIVEFCALSEISAFIFTTSSK